MSKNEEFKLKNLQSSLCDQRDNHAPCLCRIVLTNNVIHRRGREITLEYPEAVCDARENAIREKMGIIAPRYHCAQLASLVTLYRDAENNPIQEDIKYHAGCELRRKLAFSVEKIVQDYRV